MGDAQKYTCTGFSLDPARHEVLVDGAEVVLTATEFRILRTLTDEPGRVFTRSQLIQQTPGGEGGVALRAIDAHVRSIRKKLGERRDLVETIRGVGYRLRDMGGGGSPTEANWCLLAPVLPKGVVYLTPGKEHAVGREPDQPIVLPHHIVSRVHARLLPRERGWALIDCSTNGTYVGGTRLEAERDLEDGDAIEIGPFTLKLRRVEAIQDLLEDLERERQGSTPLHTGVRWVEQESDGFTAQELLDHTHDLINRRVTGTLFVSSPEASGFIVIQEGAFVAARSEELTGEDAVWALLSQRQGAFRFMTESDPQVEHDPDLKLRTSELLRLATESTRRIKID